MSSGPAQSEYIIQRQDQTMKSRNKWTERDRKSTIYLTETRRTTKTMQPIPILPNCQYGCKGRVSYRAR